VVACASLVEATAVAATTFNAGGEPDEKQALRSVFAASRCLVPATAFYEWKKLAVKAKGKTVEEKLPMCIRLKDEQPFMFAGLFSVWKNASGEEFPSFSIITTVPNPLMAKIHDRMQSSFGETFRALDRQGLQGHRRPGRS
jgi:putative SOS response-associated peptidase YedK